MNLNANYNGRYNTPGLSQANDFPTTVNPFGPQNGGASHYLGLASFRGVGSMLINADLLAALPQKTNQPPVPYANVTFTMPQTFSPQAERDTGTPDLGYHYDPLDYAFGGVDGNANLTLARGVAAGWFRTSSGWVHAGHGIHMGDQKILTFDGSAEAPNYWVRCNVVQEGGTGIGEGGFGPGGITGWADQELEDVSLSPEVRARFTRFSLLAGDGNHARDDSGYLIVRARDCEFYSGGLGGYVISCYLTNCLFDRTYGAQVAGLPGNEFHVRSCTWNGSFVQFSRAEPPIPVSIKDCAFDNTAFPVDSAGNTDFDFNAYITGAQQLSPSGGHDLSPVSSFNWQAGPVGNNFYLPPGSPLIDAGSRTATAAVLDQFTVHANLIPDSGPVAIGYHYPALPRDIYEAVVSSQGPSDWFKLNKLNNGQLNDGLINEVSGRPNLASGGGTWDPDAFVKGNSAFSFTAGSDVLTVGDVISGGNGTSQGSVSLLFRSLNRPATANRYLLSQKSSPEFRVYFDSGGLKVQIGSTVTQTIPPPSGDFGAWYVGAWYYLAITWNENTDVATWYVGRPGGTLASGTITLTANVGNSSTVFVGNRQNNDTTFSSAFREGDSFGALDQIVFWNRELTGTEINAQFDKLTAIFQGPSLDFDLSRWKLMLPVDKSNQLEDEDPATPLSGLIPLQINTGWLSSGFNYVDPATSTKKYFYREGSTMVFEVPWNGAVDPEWPRSELRGMKYDGTLHKLVDDNWKPDNSTHTLAGTCRIMDNAVGKIIIGQIHADSGLARPAITLHVDYTPISPNPSFLEVAVYDTPTSSLPGHHRLVPDLVNVALDTDIKYELTLVGTATSVTLQVKVWHNGETTPRIVDVPMNAAWLGNDLYFKAGCYYNDTKPGVNAKVAFSSLSATP